MSGSDGEALSATKHAQRAPRSRRNALAALGGLFLAWCVVVGTSFGEFDSLPEVLRGSWKLSARCALGPFAPVLMSGGVPYSLHPSVGIALSGLWLLAVVRGAWSSLPWFIHMLLPLAWCILGGLLGSTAALRYS